MTMFGAAKSPQHGFALTELLIVMLILGVLAAIAVPTFLSVRDRGYRATVDSDLRNSGVAMEVWRSLSGTDRYPVEGEINLPVTEPGVTVTIGFPVDTSDAPVFCLEGSHASLASGAVVATYDQRLGGVTDSTSC